MADMNDKVFQMRVSEDFLRRVDDWRREQPGIPSRSESIRVLVEKSLGPRVARPNPTTAIELGREYSTDAADVLREIANDPKQSAAARRKATSALTKRGIKLSD